MCKDKIKIVQGDITKESCEAIVNAANGSLLGGGGVDGAIHRAAGSELLEECKSLGGCAIGQAKITKSYNLKDQGVKWIIHAVGPRWLNGLRNEDKLLEGAYFNSLKLAVEHNVKTVAFPSISTGIFRFPLEQASSIAISTIGEFLKDHDELQEVRIVCFDLKTYGAYEEAKKKYFTVE